jgi:NlpC/P60 family putative phage cell wall peptidase
MSNDSAAARAAIIKEARTWLGTPFKHATGIKRVGCDCVFLCLRTMQARRLAPLDFDPRPYPRDWYMHKTEELILKGLSVHARQITEEEATTGDIAVYRIGHTASHLAIIVDARYIIHAYAPQKIVGLHERRSPLRGHLDSYWSVLGREALAP